MRTVAPSFQLPRETRGEREESEETRGSGLSVLGCDKWGYEKDVGKLSDGARVGNVVERVEREGVVAVRG